MMLSCLPLGVSILQILATGLWVGGIQAQDTSPRAPTQPNIAANCVLFHTINSTDLGCSEVETEFNITHAQFIAWNPDVTSDCSSGFWPDYSYCVKVGIVSTTSSKTSTTSSKTSTSSKSTITTSATTNATYSYSVPLATWNLTTSTIESTFPPQKTQAGQPSYCNDWYYVEIGDTCDKVVASSSWITMSDFLTWNPTIHSDCSGLFNGWWVCIGIQPQTMTASFTCVTTQTTAVIPDSTVYVPTPFPTIDSSFIPEPTRAGMPSNCQAYYQAQTDESCLNIIASGFVTEEQFFAWNPALDGNCNGLYVDYYYCVAAFDSATPLPEPTLSTVFARPTEVPVGQPSACTKWYSSTAAETCDDIVAIFAAFSLSNLISWNPTLNYDCSGKVAGAYYCIAVTGTPITRTTPIPSTTAAPTATPTQSGLASDCSKLWLVSGADTCTSISQANGITETQFYSWNPALGTSTCTNLTADLYVCVSTTTATITSMSIPSTLTTSSATTSSSAPASCTGGTAPPEQTQAGISCLCNNWVEQADGVYCYDMAAAADITLDVLYSLNPALNGDCSGLWAGYAYCAGLATVEDCDGGTTAPEPTQAGIPCKCNTWIEQADGLYCYDMAAASGITLDTLYSLNPALNGDCSGLWGGYAYCAGVAP